MYIPTFWHIWLVCQVWLTRDAKPFYKTQPNASKSLRIRFADEQMREGKNEITARMNSNELLA
jgi:hypothetical protein